MTEEEPEIIPPRGVTCPSNTPFERTVGIISESALYAITERTLGLNVPTSYKSFCARMASVSTNPNEELGAINPG